MDLRERRIALLFTMRTAIQRQVLHGISRFAMGLPHWHWRGALPVDSVHKTLAAWKPDGIIGSIESPEMIQLVKQLGVPSIDMSNCMANPHCARIGVDDEKIGRTAAEYFIERGFKSFGYVDGANLWFSEVRGRSFASALQKAGFSCQTIQIPDAEKAPRPSPFWVTDNSCLKAWLRKLPKPVAVFASCDLFAMIVLLCCNETGIAVPDSAAVLGVDNDEILCALARPSLSSISQPAEEIGFAAAELLEKMMRGEAPMESHRLFSPGGRGHAGIHGYIKHRRPGRSRCRSFHPRKHSQTHQRCAYNSGSGDFATAAGAEIPQVSGVNASRRNPPCPRGTGQAVAFANRHGHANDRIACGFR